MVIILRVLLLFTFNSSLHLWHKVGILSREVSLYKGLLKHKNLEYKFLTYGGSMDQKYSQNLSGIEIIPAKNLIPSRNRKFSIIKSFLLPLTIKNEFKNHCIYRMEKVTLLFLT